MLQVNDDKKYVDFGYVPCNGHVPCQPAHLSPENVILMMMMMMMMFIIVMMVMTQMKVMMRITTHAMGTYPVSPPIFLVISMMVMNLIMTLMMMVVISPFNSHMTKLK